MNTDGPARKVTITVAQYNELVKALPDPWGLVPRKPKAASPTRLHVVKVIRALPAVDNSAEGEAA